MKNILDALPLSARMLAGVLALVVFSPVALAFDLGDLVDKKSLDQAAREKLGVKTDTANASDVGIPLTGTD